MNKKKIILWLSPFLFFCPLLAGDLLEFEKPHGGDQLR